jgi:Synaptobrevin
MSTSTTPASLDLQEQIVRIDRAIAETHKLQNESDKFAAEARKMRREYWLAPILAIVTVIGGLVGFISGAITLLRMSGKG